MLTTFAILLDPIAYRVDSTLYKSHLWERITFILRFQLRSFTEKEKKFFFLRQKLTYVNVIGHPTIKVYFNGQILKINLVEMRRLIGSTSDFWGSPGFGSENLRVERHKKTFKKCLTTIIAYKVLLCPNQHNTSILTFFCFKNFLL